MSEHITTGKGFAEIALENRKTKRTFLDDISKIIDWRPVEKLLKRHYKRVQSADGRPAYPALSMFKILLLQRWYTLSDEGIEEAMYDRNFICSIQRFIDKQCGARFNDHM